MNANSDLNPDLLASLPAGHPRTLVHLLSCVHCRDSALSGMLDSDESFVGQPRRDADARRATLQAGAGVLPIGQSGSSLREPASEDERLQVDRLVATLEHLASEDLKPTWKGKRYATPAVLSAVLKRGEETLRLSPGNSERLGLLALVLAGQQEELHPRWVPAGVIQAGLLIGAARRAQDKLKGASLALSQIGPFLMGPLEEASYAREVGLVRWQQGLSQDAAALLTHAAEVFAGAGEAGHEAACWALLGLLLREDLEGERAFRSLAPLLRSLPELNPEEFPLLALRVRLALALCEGERAAFDKAEIQLTRARSLVGLVKPGERALDPALSIAWTDARLRDLDRRPKEAEQLLVPVRLAL